MIRDWTAVFAGGWLGISVAMLKVGQTCKGRRDDANVDFYCRNRLLIYCADRCFSDNYFAAPRFGPLSAYAYLLSDHVASVGVSCEAIEGSE
jgi:hypothetical protein